MQMTRGELKSKAYHEVVALKLRANPSLANSALQRLQWLRDMNPAARTYYDEWQRLLQGPLDILLCILIDDSEHSRALRQENPFCDLVTQPERAAIYDKVVRQLDQGRAQ